MKRLKKMLYKVLSRTISLEAFEAWLYADKYVNEQLLSNNLILELLSLNLRSKFAMMELETFCFKHFKREDFLVYLVKFNCEDFLGDKNDEGVDRFFENLDRFFNWEDDFKLINQFTNINDKWYLAKDGWISKSDVRNELIRFSSAVIENFLGSNEDERIKMLENGIILKVKMSHNKQTENTNQKPPKMWFQFWK